MTANGKTNKKVNLPGPSTQSVHMNRGKNPYHAVSYPVIQSATYGFDDTADLRQYMEKKIAGNCNGRVEYGRYGNPTIAEVEKRMAGLEGAEQAILFSSGMAAITNILLALLPTGSHIVVTDDSYRRTREFTNNFLSRLGIGCTVVPMGEYQQMEEAIQPNTRLILSESPTNPYLRVLDLERFGEIGKRHDLISIVDSTFATPINIKPLEWGIDLVVHSATKYLGGHNDLLAGVACGGVELVSTLRNALNVFGAVSDPQNAALLLRGLKTLGLRIQRQNESGMAMAEYLKQHPLIEKVWYPGLPCHPDHKLAVQQMKGFGGVVSFTYKGDLEQTSKLIDSMRMPIIAPSFGGVETLIEQPALISYFEYSSKERSQIGISDNLVRFSLGIEDTQDLIDDVAQALETINK